MKSIFSLKFVTMIFLIIIFTSASFQGTSISTTTNKASSLPPIVKIGFLYPATGSLGPMGPSLMAGAVAAAYRINMTYGKFFNVSIDAKNTATDPITAKTSAQALVVDGVQVIVGAAASGATMAASEVTIPNSIPLISYASSNPTISTLNDSNFLFRTVASDSDEGIALANLAYNQGYHDVYVLYLDNVLGIDTSSNFTASFTSLGGVIDGQIAYDPASSSFSTEISTIKSANPSAIVMVSYPFDANDIFAEAKTQGLTGPFFGTDGITSSLVTNNTGTRDYLKGKLFGTTPTTGANVNQTLYPQFTNDLKATGGTFGNYGDYVYDSFLLAAAAVNTSGTYNGQAIRDALYTISNGFKGATNTNKAFNCFGDPVSQTYDLWNDTNYVATTMKTAAISFIGLGVGSCSNTNKVQTSTVTPITLPTTTSPSSSQQVTSTSASNSSSEFIPSAGTISASPGFEILSFMIGFATILFIVERKRK